MVSVKKTSGYWPEQPLGLQAGKRQMGDHDMQLRTSRLPYLLGTIAVLLVYSAAPASGQGFLQRLEERVRQRLAEGAAVSPPSPPAPPAALPESAPPDNERPMLGIEVDEVPRRGLSSEVVVAGVRPNSIAAAADLQPGDQIVSFGGVPISSVRDLSGVMQRSQWGDRLLMVVQREGQQVELAVRLQAERRQASEPEELPRPASPTISTAPPLPRSPTEEVESVLPESATMRDPVQAEGGRLGLVVEEPQGTRGERLTRGALVVEVTPGAPGAEAGLKVGDIIVAFDGRLIPDAQSMIRQMRRTRPGQRVELQYVRGQQLGRVQVTLAGPDDVRGSRNIEGEPEQPRALDETISRSGGDAPVQQGEPAESGLDALGSVLGGFFGGGAGGGTPRTTRPEDAATLYTCPMHPQIRHAEQGKCPICGMPLTEATQAAEDNGDEEAAVLSESPAPATTEVLPSPAEDLPPSLQAADLENASSVELHETIRHLEATNRRLESRLQQLEEQMKAILQATAEEE